MNPNITNTDADKADMFHTTIDKTLFLCKREITNIQLTLPFLCTRVKGTDKDN